MSNKKVGCLCVAAARSILLPIALASYEEQTYRRYAYLLMFYDTPRERLCETLDIGCHTLFDVVGCDYVAIWDDDDYSPPGRLEQAVALLDGLTVCGRGRIAGYDRGWFANVKTLRAERVVCDGYLWGGSMVFDRRAWQRVGGFTGKPVPGQDRALQAGAHCVSIAAADCELPVAFCHGKNMSTMMHTPGIDNDIVNTMPIKVQQAVHAASDHFKLYNIHVPQPEV